MVPEETLEINQCNAIRKNQNEVIFFKHLHAEFNKVSSFFEKAKKELKIRFDRVKAGSEILSHSDSKTVLDKWTTIGRSIYKLHSSLSLLETYAIMNYCAFSKILKKHDKKTGYSTKMAFMRNVVNKSNFAAYPDVLSMIRECETLCDQASQNVKREGNLNLREDEELFIGMVHKINTEEKETKDKDVVNKNSRFIGHNAVVTPITEKRVRSVSDSSMSSDGSELVGRNKLKGSITGTVFDCSDDQAHHFARTTYRRAKKQRCL